ncbi:hypothetical protein [Herpetosiphon gulosus]|uniref:Uncharacterized protein n=1 Tax=Herpetosiphon gulosus TaxID=1973496 RepID=A0ABP9WX10_9CHLR
MPNVISIACGVTPWAFRISTTTAWLWSSLLVAATIWAKAMGLMFYDWFADRSAWLDGIRLTIGNLLVIWLSYVVFRSPDTIYTSFIGCMMLDYLTMSWIIKQRSVKAINRDPVGQLQVVDHKPTMYESPIKIAVMINLFAIAAAILGSLLFFFVSVFVLS